MTTPDQPAPGQAHRLAEAADMRIEIVKRELNQGALSGFESTVGDYAAGLVIAALDSFDAAALKAEYERGVRDGKVLQTIFGNSLENLQAEFERGVAEGRRQATEGWKRHWGVSFADVSDVQRFATEESARKLAGPHDWVMYRLVGPWETAEQTQDGAR